MNLVASLAAVAVESNGTPAVVMTDARIRPMRKDRAQQAVFWVFLAAVLGCFWVYILTLDDRPGGVWFFYAVSALAVLAFIGVAAVGRRHRR